MNTMEDIQVGGVRGVVVPELHTRLTRVTSLEEMDTQAWTPPCQ